ncbi:hypothetical protein Dsin_023992 [Dipteronia sinensis]|uniref:Ribosomal RNA-processing protein 14 N-terminal domain-containing protein n=1 Tax=Dipteronia sinensis TaxID=43782 RepID=A0AAE0E2M3_9ROSI|nr:hypothetical protein Dsin_023992 [Dipteronia sinensis]
MILYHQLGYLLVLPQFDSLYRWGSGKREILNEGSPAVDLKSIIRSSLFFDKLVELIPAKFYLPVDELEKPWFQGLSKDEKALAKK